MRDFEPNDVAIFQLDFSYPVQEPGDAVAGERGDEGCAVSGSRGLGVLRRPHVWRSTARPRKRETARPVVRVALVQHLDHLARIDAEVAKNVLADGALLVELRMAHVDDVQH